MIKLALLLGLTSVFISCSRQQPVFETKKVVVQEDKRNISELKATTLLNDASSETSISPSVSRRS